MGNAGCSLSAKVERYDLERMHALLYLWGRVCEQVRHWNGYPSMDTTHRALFGRGGSGSRLPIPEIPSVVVQLNAKVLTLPDEECNAVTIWYAYNANPHKGRWTLADKALVLNLTEQQLRRRVMRAKVRLIASCDNLL